MFRILSVFLLAVVSGVTAHPYYVDCDRTSTQTGNDVATLSTIMGDTVDESTTLITPSSLTFDNSNISLTLSNLGTSGSVIHTTGGTLRPDSTTIGWAARCNDMTHYYTQESGQDATITFTFTPWGDSSVEILIPNKEHHHLYTTTRMLPKTSTSTIIIHALHPAHLDDSMLPQPTQSSSSSSSCASMWYVFDTYTLS